MRRRRLEPKSTRRVFFSLRDEAGQDLVEYGLLIVLVVLIAAAAISPLGTSIGSLLKEEQYKFDISNDFQAITKLVDSLPLGQIAFNPPDSMEIDKEYPFYLRLSEQESVQALEKELQSQLKGQHIESHQIRIAPVMEASLTGETFSILPKEPTTQAIDPQMTEWRWYVTPTRGGKRELHLTLSVILGVDGKDRRHTIKTFDKTFEVHVAVWRRTRDFAKDNWQFLSVVPVALLWLWRRREKQKQKKQKPWDVP